MPLSIGDRLGIYEILAPLGAGGMGEVYRARDTRLDRDVAIKVLPAALAQHPERLARFEREAKVLAALNHPNIAAIYGLEGSAIVMELVEGPTLADRLKGGVLPLREALEIARQIGSALEAAHDKGIIHRDLKPANVEAPLDSSVIDAPVKVLDFGLATVGRTSTSDDGDPEQSPTLTIGATEAGMILGTAAYMSPEQASGKKVDKRADIWSFGVVLWEMLTGSRLFGGGETVSHTLADVLRAEIDFTKLPAATPAPIRELLRRCLDRDVKNRLRDIGEARVAIQRVLANPESGVSNPAQAGSLPHKHSKVAWAVVALLLIAVTALGFVHFREKPQEARVLHTSILPPENTAFPFAQGIGLMALSPDGRKIVFGARTADGKSPLWVRSLDVPTAQPLAGTDGAAFPFWSPDSRFIAFFADGKLKKIDASGGPAITLADAALGRGGSWSPEGVIVFAPANVIGPLLRVSASGGAATPVSSEAGSFPWFLPDGKHFLYQEQVAGRELLIRVGSLDGAKSKLVAKGSTNAVYAQEHILYLHDGTLMAQEFDMQRMETKGEAVPVAEQIETVLNSGRVGAFSASATGLLVYRQGASVRGKALTWFDRSGRQGATLGDAAHLVGNPRFSPDRKRVATSIQGDGIGTNIWIYDVSRGLRTRLTFGPGSDSDPVWSPDGRSIIFRSNRKGRFDLYKKAADGSGSDELVYADGSDKGPSSWSPDGKFLLYFTDVTTAKTGYDIFALPLTSAPPGAPLKPFVIVQTPFTEAAVHFSPDGKWIAYQSNESGRYEIYVAPFPPGAGGKRQISVAGGAAPRWRQDGAELFYVGPDARLMAAEVSISGGSVEVGQVHVLFALPNSGNIAGSGAYDVSADGQRFLYPVPAEQKSADPLTLIENWAAGLRK